MACPFQSTDSPGRNLRLWRQHRWKTGILDGGDAVVLARVASITKDGQVMLRPGDPIGFKVRPLRQKYADVAAIWAFQPTGIIQTLYSIEEAEVDCLLRRGRGHGLATSENTTVSDDLAEEIAQLASMSAGQGILLDAETRRAIELHAEDIAKNYYEDRGFSVEKFGKPFDLRCRKGKQVLYVEVKGTQGAASEIILTRNEVEFARKNKAAMVLFVVDSIRIVEKRGKKRAEGGKQRLLSPWVLDDAALSPMNYRYELGL